MRSIQAGYSKTPLYKKLGIKEGLTIAVFNQPMDYVSVLGELAGKVKLSRKAENDLDIVHYFTTSQGDLKNNFPSLKSKIKKNGMVWISWPKKSSKMSSDLNDNIVREIGLDSGLVDVKICAIDNVWSAMKFVYRLKDR